jgi:hypothetical protein
MIMRWQTLLGLSVSASVGVALLSCRGPVVSLGGGGAGAGGCAWGTTQPTCDGQSDAGGTPSDGSGYNAHIAPACLVGDGTMQMPSGAAQIAQELVGLWSDCGGGCKGNASISLSGWLGMGDNLATGIEFTADGHYYVLDADQDTTMLVRTTATGTFAVQDASATLGAGTYQVLFHPIADNLFQPQVVVFDSPRKIRFIMVGTASSEDFAPALPMTFRKGVCTSVQLGPAHVFTSPEDMSAQVQGRWIWCSGPMNDFCGPVVGVEFLGDGTWYLLTEDASGNVARSTDPQQHGTYADSDAGGGGNDCLPALGLSVEGDGTYGFIPTVGECRRALTVTQFDGTHAKPTDVFLPLP